MKTIMITLTASLVLGALALPLVTAEEECGRAGPTEAIAHPTKTGSYLFLDLTQPDKVGEWAETNAANGLQTLNCFRFGVFHYAADEHATVLG